MRNNLNKNAGFTLVELIVVIGIFTVMSVGLLNILSTSFRTSQTIQDAMVCQQQSEMVINAIRANLANAEELGVFNNKPSAIPDPAITDATDPNTGALLLDKNGKKFVDEYCYMYFNEDKGGLVINNYNPETKKRTESLVGDARYLNMNSSSFTDVRFALGQDGVSLDVYVNAMIMDNHDPTIKTRADNYSLSTQVAMDENVCQLDEDLNVKYWTSNGRCIRFRRMNFGKNYTWADVTNFEINQDGSTPQAVQLGSIRVEDAAAGKGSGTIVAYNQNDTPWMWTLSNASLGGRKVKTVTSSDVNATVLPDGKVTFTPKYALPKTERNFGYTFEFTFEPITITGEQKVTASVDLTNGKGYITVKNTTSENYDWSIKINPGCRFSNFSLVNSTAGGGTANALASPVGSMTDITVTGSMPHNDSEVGINFTFTPEAGDLTVTPSFDSANKKGKVKVVNSLAENKDWNCMLTFSNPLKSFTIDGAMAPDFKEGDSYAYVEGLITANTTTEYNFTYETFNIGDPFEVTLNETKTDNYDNAGVIGIKYDYDIVVNNPNDDEETQDWAIDVPLTGKITLLSQEGAIDITDNIKLKGNITLASGEKTTVDGAAKVLRVSYFVEPVTMPTFKCVACAQKGSNANCFRMQVNVTNNHPSKWLTSVRVLITLPNGSTVEDVYCDNRDSNGNLYASETSTPKGKAYGVNFDPAVGPGETSKGTSDSGDYFNYQGGAAYTHFGCNVGYINTTNPSTAGTVSGTSNQAGKVKIEVIGEPVYEDSCPVRY